MKHFPKFRCWWRFASMCIDFLCIYYVNQHTSSKIHFWNKNLGSAPHFCNFLSDFLWIFKIFDVLERGESRLEIKFYNYLFTKYASKWVTIQGDYFLLKFHWILLPDLRPNHYMKSALKPSPPLMSSPLQNHLTQLIWVCVPS